MVHNVGCIYLNKTEVDYPTANKTCVSQNATLASPATDGIFWKLTKHLITTTTTIREGVDLQFSKNVHLQMHFEDDTDVVSS